MAQQHKDHTEIGIQLNGFRKHMEIPGDERKKSKVNNVSGTRRWFRGRLLLTIFILLGFAGTGSLLYGQGTTTDALFIDKNGNVGIGTNKPSATLDVRGQIKDESGFVMPRGGIIMWSGQVSDIPQGWVLCDGTKGTPDLRGRFIIGADNEQSLKPNDKGEPDTHDHSTTTKTFQTSADGEHYHLTCPNWVHNKTYDHQGDRHVVDPGNTNVQEARTSKEGIHAHTVDLRSQKTGIDDGPNRPRWYALCFIMKL